VLSGNSDVRFKFKTVRVELGSDATTDPVTRSHFQISGRDDERSVQVNAMWTCTWQASSYTPLLKSISVSDYEEIMHQLSAGRTLFSDCTQSVFRSSDVCDRQLANGIDFWTDRFDGAIARPAAGHGIAIGDVNSDGLDDAYLCQSPALPNLLLIQQPNGTVIDTAAEAGVNWLEGTRAAILNDLDYDNDSDLDLFICGYTLSVGVNLDDVFANPMPFEDATNGAPNVMLRNDGNWGFTDVTDAIGMGKSMKFSYGSSWDDYDGDGDLDCYIANDFGRNNGDGNFTDTSVASGVTLGRWAWGSVFADFNNDGWQDLYVTNGFITSDDPDRDL
jgi:hypothetical protein